MTGLLPISLCVHAMRAGTGRQEAGTFPVLAGFPGSAVWYNAARKEASMTYRGHVKNGVVVLDDAVTLPEGIPAEVYVSLEKQIGECAEGLKDKAFNDSVAKESEKRSEEKAKSKISEIVSNLPNYIAEILAGTMYPCDKCGTPKALQLNVEQVRNLLNGQMQMNYCDNPNCLDYDPGGPGPHVIKLYFGSVLLWKLKELRLVE
jgi:hypothetical protein